jgi:nitrogen-specific signal transduction histidine kinase
MRMNAYTERDYNLIIASLLHMRGSAELLAQNYAEINYNPEARYLELKADRIDDLIGAMDKQRQTQLSAKTAEPHIFTTEEIGTIVTALVSFSAAAQLLAGGIMKTTKHAIADAIISDANNAEELATRMTENEAATPETAH